MKKETFIIRTEWWDAISKLNEIEQANILKNLFRYHINSDEELEKISLSVELVWSLILNNLKFNINKYDKRRETSAENGAKGGRPPKPKKPNNKPNKPIITLTDTVTDIETVSELETKTDTVITETKVSFEYDKFLIFFNQNIKPTILSLTDKRKKMVATLLKSYSKNQIMEVIIKCKESDFLSGKIKSENKTPFKASFDWIFKPANFIKILEGNYDNSTPAKQEIPSFQNDPKKWEVNV
jgi:hypothetical protein